MIFILTHSAIEKKLLTRIKYLQVGGLLMARKKKRSRFQKLTIFMAWLMAVITLFGVIAGTIGALANAGMFN